MRGRKAGHAAAKIAIIWKKRRAADAGPLLLVRHRIGEAERGAQLRRGCSGTVQAAAVIAVAVQVGLGARARGGLPVHLRQHRIIIIVAVAVAAIAAVSVSAISSVASVHIGHVALIEKIPL